MFDLSQDLHDEVLVLRHVDSAADIQVSGCSITKACGERSGWAKRQEPQAKSNTNMREYCACANTRIREAVPHEKNRQILEYKNIYSNS